MPARLMIPGPVTVEEEVLNQMGGPVQAHYGPHWTAIYNESGRSRTNQDMNIALGLEDTFQ